MVWGFFAEVSSRLAMDLLDDVLNWFRKILLKRKKIDCWKDRFFRLKNRCCEFLSSCQKLMKSHEPIWHRWMLQSVFLSEVKKNRGKQDCITRKRIEIKKFFFPEDWCFSKYLLLKTARIFSSENPKTARFWMSQLELRGQIMSCFGWDDVGMMWDDAWNDARDKTNNSTYLYIQENVYWTSRNLGYPIIIITKVEALWIPAWNFDANGFLLFDRDKGRSIPSRGLSVHMPPGEEENHRLKSDFVRDMFVTRSVYPIENGVSTDFSRNESR